MYFLTSVPTTPKGWCYRDEWEAQTYQNPGNHTRFSDLAYRLGRTFPILRKKRAKAPLSLWSLFCPAQSEIAKILIFKGYFCPSSYTLGVIVGTGFAFSKGELTI